MIIIDRTVGGVGGGGCVVLLWQSWFGNPRYSSLSSILRIERIGQQQPDHRCHFSLIGRGRVVASSTWLVYLPTHYGVWCNSTSRSGRGIQKRKKWKEKKKKNWAEACGNLNEFCDQAQFMTIEETEGCFTSSFISPLVPKPLRICLSAPIP